MAAEIVALRDIEPGEEISYSCKRRTLSLSSSLLTVQDAPFGYTYKQRRDLFKQIWGFECKCSMCSASTKQKRESDARRERLLELHRILTGLHNPALASIDELVHEAMAIIDKEELRPQLAAYYPLFARAYMRLTKLDLARKYTELAEETQLWYVGGDDDYADDARLLRQELEAVEKRAGQRQSTARQTFARFS
jgi:hypothetical protein